MCLMEKLRFNIKVKSRTSELFVLKKNDFLRLSVNFKEFIEKFLHKSLMVYLKYNEKRKRLIEEYESLMVKVNQQGLMRTNKSNANATINGDGNDYTNDANEDFIEDIINATPFEEEKENNEDNNSNQSNGDDLDSSFLNSKKNIKTEELKKKMNFALVESKLINSQFSSKNSIKKQTEILNEDMNKNDIQNNIQIDTTNSNTKFQKKIEAIIEYLESNGIAFPDSENNPKILFKQLMTETDLAKREALVLKIEDSIKQIYNY